MWWKKSVNVSTDEGKKTRRLIPCQTGKNYYPARRQEKNLKIKINFPTKEAMGNISLIAILFF